MSLKRRIVWLVAIVLLAVGFVTGALVFMGRPVDGGEIRFPGWTNISGARHAVFEIPPVMKEEGGTNKFGAYHHVYNVHLEIVGTRSDGTRVYLSSITTGDFSPTDVTRVAVSGEVEKPESLHFRLTKAEGWVERRWGNFRIGLTIKRFFFRPPKDPEGEWQ